MQGKSSRALCAEQLKRRCRMLCESGNGAACNAALETCMGNTRKRLQRRTMEEVSGAEALGVGATQVILLL